MILFKKDSSNKILQWSAVPVSDEEGTHIKISYGELGGKTKYSYEKNIKGKNIGKMNATSPDVQRKNRIESLYNKKLKQGYKSLFSLGWSMEDELAGVDVEVFLQENLKYHSTDENENPKPMLCQQYYRSSKDFIAPDGKEYKDRKYYYISNPSVEKDPKHIIMKFPCFIQPKINGIRAMVKMDDDGNVLMLSKTGLTYNIPHIQQIFENNLGIFITEDGQDVIFDGELYIPHESINVINSAVQASNLNTSRLEYRIFDIAIKDIKQGQRLILLRDIFRDIERPLDKMVRLVTTSRIVSDKEAQEYTDRYVELGYEGSVLRNSTGLYLFGKRLSTMVKLKRTLSDEFMIVDVIPQDKNPDLGLFVCRTKKGEEFSVTPTDTTEYKQMILALKHKFINKPLQCQFYEYTDTGKPFHIINCIVRDYE